MLLEGKSFSISLVFLIYSACLINGQLACDGEECKLRFFCFLFSIFVSVVYIYSSYHLAHIRREI